MSISDSPSPHEQPLKTGVAGALNGDNTTGHVTTAAVIGGAIASILSWFLQLGHVPPPPEVTAALSVLCAVGASWFMQRMGQS